jgi:hypothetical protein
MTHPFVVYIWSFGEPLRLCLKGSLKNAVNSTSILLRKKGIGNGPLLNHGRSLHRHLPSRPEVAGVEAEVVDIPVTTTADQMEVAVHQVLPISQTIPDTQIPHSLPKWLCRRSRPNIYYTIISTSRYRYSRRRSRNYEFNFRIRHLLLAGPLRHSFDNHTYNFLSHSKTVRHPMKILELAQAL